MHFMWFPAVSGSRPVSIQQTFVYWITWNRLVDPSYYRINKLLWRWSKKDGARIVHDAQLSMEKAPPPLPERPPAQAAPRKPAPKPPKPDPLVKMVDDLGKVANAFSRFKTWLETPDPPKPSKPPKPVKQDEMVPPFDIQEIPGAMRKEMMPVGAKLMGRWFAGRLNYSPTDANEQAKINQDGKSYALIPYKGMGDLFTTDICGGDPQQLHKLFQFQLAEVDGTLAEKIRIQLVADAENSGVPDDLTAALGSFNFYAAVGHVRFSTDIAHGLVMSNATIAEVTGIWVYVKDDYTFTDKQGDRSQYLGHWSSDGVIVIPLDGVAAISPYIPYVESPVTLGNPVIKGEVHYPIHNSDFRQWQIKHQRGGDFIVYTDRRFVPVVPPIKVHL